MAELFKNIFTTQFFDHLADGLSQINCSFKKDKLFSKIYDSTWDKMELKERTHHIAGLVRANLSDAYKDCVNELYLMIAYFKKKESEQIKFPRLAYLFIPDIIENYGIHDFKTSVAAMESITSFVSCEFAIRPFIVEYKEKMFVKILTWTKSKNEHVRRLASEGSRPRLPWGMALKSLKENPEPILPILETLKNDDSEYVRKSVANSLNDISKDNPEIVINIAKSWKGKTAGTDWIVKHACRSLLKAGKPEVMLLFGFCPPDDIEIKDFKLQNDIVHIGEDLEFSFDLINQSADSKKIRLEYGVYYMKKNGVQSKKVYKISEKDYAPNSVTNINRKQSFKLITTRKFHVGQHLVSLIINGIEVVERAFQLTL